MTGTKRCDIGGCGLLRGHRGKHDARAQIIYRSTDRLTPGATKAIEELRSAAIELALSCDFLIRHTCDSNASSTWHYIREAEKAMDRTRASVVSTLALKKVVQHDLTPIAIETTTPIKPRRSR